MHDSTAIRPRPPASLKALLVGSILVPLILFATFSWREWNVAWQTATDRVDRQARIMADHIQAIFEVPANTVATIAERISGAAPDPIPREALHEVLNRRAVSTPIITAISVIGPDGSPIANSASPIPPDDNYADRDYFQLAAGGADLVIGPAVEGRLTGLAAFPVAKRIDGGDGRFGGVVVSGVPLQPVQDFFAQLEGEVGRSVTVARRDGTVLLRIPEISTGVEVLSADSGFMRTLAADPRGGEYRTVSQLDRIDRLHMLRPVADGAIYVSFGVQTDAIFRDWLRLIAPMALVTLLGSAAMAAMALLAMRRTRGEAVAFVRWREEVDHRARAEAALAQAQRIEAVGLLTGGVAHDVNNHLQVIGANLQLLKTEPDLPPGAADRIAAAQAGVDRAASLTDKLLLFARQQPLEPKPINLARVVREMGDLLRRTLGSGVDVEIIVDGGLWNALADPVQVENAVVNLAVNARDAMQGQGKLTLELGNAMLNDAYAAEHADVTPGQYVMLAVSDNGPGMTPDVMARAFQPFFTTKPVGEGTGLGLASVHGFAKQSGGHAKIYSEVGHGTTVKIYLPRSSAPEAVAPPPPEHMPGGDETVLVVEDDAAVRAATAAMVQSLGYRVLTAENAEDALAKLQSAGPVDLMFTDVVMPGRIPTPELARRAVALRPGLLVLYTSGYTANAIVHHGRLDEGVALLPKPYTREALARKLRQILDGKPAPAPMPPPGPAAPPLRILLVEDEPLVAMATAEEIRRLGHHVLQADTAPRALAILAEQRVDVLLTDVHLPGRLSGTDLAQEVRRTNPRIRVIYATGQAVRELDGPVLRKPYSVRDLRRALDGVSAPRG